jgi:hypothetical protein
MCYKNISEESGEVIGEPAPALREQTSTLENQRRSFEKKILFRKGSVILQVSSLIGNSKKRRNNVRLFLEYNLFLNLIS